MMKNEISNLAVVIIDREDLKFSAAHFTLFSATQRERLHGHNFYVSLELTSKIKNDGMSVNYTLYRDKIKNLCLQLNEYTLMPQFSPFLSIKEEGAYYLAEFNQEKMFFLKNDTLILPLRNISNEELCRWFLEKIIQASDLPERNLITEIKIKISSAAGQKHQIHHRMLDEK